MEQRLQWIVAKWSEVTWLWQSAVHYMHGRDQTKGPDDTQFSYSNYALLSNQGEAKW